MQIPIPKWAINCPYCNKEFEILLNTEPFVDCLDCNIRINLIWYQYDGEEYPRKPLIRLVEPLAKL